MADAPSKMDFGKELSRGMLVHSTLTQEVLVTTADKLRLCLIGHKEALSCRTGWVAPLGILLALVCALVAADFKDALLLSKEAWHNLFTASAGACALWFLWSAVRACRSSWVHWRMGSQGTIDDIVDELKVTTPEVRSLLEGTPQHGNAHPPGARP